MSILVVGSVALDTIETPHGRVDRVIGGSAVYFSLAASYFAPVRLVGVVGEDFPPEARALLEQRGVDLSGLEVASGKTFFWHGKYSENLKTRTSTATELNVFENFTPRIPEAFRDSAIVFLANIHPRLQMDVIDQILRPSLVMADTMDYWIENTPEELAELMRSVDGIIINDEEAEMLGRRPQFAGRRKESHKVRAPFAVDRTQAPCDSGGGGSSELQITNARLQAADELCNIGHRLIDELGMKVAVIKRGSRGAVLITEGYPDFFCPACTVPRVVDPTGAGDTFAGGFMGMLAHMNDFSPRAMHHAMLFATAMASFAIENFGPYGLVNLSPDKISARVDELMKSIPE